MKENVANTHDFQPTARLGGPFFFFSCLSHGARQSATVAAHLFHLEGHVLYGKKIKSQSPSKLLKLSQPENKNK